MTSVVPSDERMESVSEFVSEARYSLTHVWVESLSFSHECESLRLRTFELLFLINEICCFVPVGSKTVPDMGGFKRGKNIAVYEVLAENVTL